MEELVGGLWHRLITRAARRDYPDAAITLAEIEKTAGVLFRAFGGEPGLRVAAAAQVRHGARRRLLDRIAGAGERAAQAALDGETLQLPPQIALFPQRPLNRDLYLWLIALAAADAPDGADWLTRNQAATRRALERFPGLQPRYERLVRAVLEGRIPPERLPAEEAEAERLIRSALREPGAATGPLPPARRPPQPVPLWLHPSPELLDRSGDQRSAPPDDEEGGGGTAAAQNKRYRAQREEMPDGRDGFLMMFRAESLLSWAEYIRVNRPQDDEPNPDAARAAEDMEQLNVARDGKRSASRVRFDLDLPSAAQDDVPLSEGILLPEWDFRRRNLRPDYCRVIPMLPRDAHPAALPDALRRPARRLRQQFSALQPVRHWLKGQPEGQELDIDACVRVRSDRLAGVRDAGAGTYLRLQPVERDLACLVLADLSLSTDAAISDTHRVIDVVKDSLMLFAEALAATGDRYALYGFSSLERTQVRMLELKRFDQRWDAAARGRVAALRPGYYTRMGAAIRHAHRLLAAQRTTVRLLLLLTDGKPNDLDHYEGRYGIEDTRAAVHEARRAGLRPFCVTIDREGASYLPHLFGPTGYTIIRKPEDLPARLPLLYAQLTQA